jgi:hypothetical protein
MSNRFWFNDESREYEYSDDDLDIAWEDIADAGVPEEAVHVLEMLTVSVLELRKKIEDLDIRITVLEQHVKKLEDNFEDLIHDLRKLVK